MSEGAGRLDEEGAAALILMVQALELLDRCDAAFDVGAHLDLAICRLRQMIEAGPPPNDCALPDESPT